MTQQPNKEADQDQPPTVEDGPSLEYQFAALAGAVLEQDRAAVLDVLRALALALGGDALGLAFECGPYLLENGQAQEWHFLALWGCFLA